MNPAPAPAQSSKVRPAQWLASQARNWAGSDGQRWLFVVKVMLAAFGALWLAFRLDLDSPNTAMTTTFILALPSSGMVLEKAFYRLLGTLAGSASALLLVGLFPQQAPLLFLGLALWIALCTGGSALYRNHQSYSFVLAGYTAVIIAVPALDHPAAVFSLAVTRVSEVGLGIIVATVVHDALFPRHQSVQVMRTVQARYLRFTDFCRHVLEHRLAPAETELAHLRFAADIAALESGRAAAFFEAAHARAHTRQLHAFNSAFMAALTTFYTLHRLTHRLRLEPSPATSTPASPVPALIEPLLAQLAAGLARGEDLHGAALADLQAALDDAIAATRLAGEATPGLPASPQQIDLETALELLQRFARQFGDFATLYHGLAQNKRSEVSEPQAYTPKTPPAIVLASGFRAAVALLATATVWYWLAWPYAPNAMLMTAIFAALASSSPHPTALIKQILAGFVLGWPLSFITEFFLVLPADSYPMLVLAALPLFALAAWLMTDPKRAGMGVGMSLFGAQVVAPLNLMHYDVASFLSTTLALQLGVVLAYVIFATVLPGHTMGHKGHVAGALWREARATCVSSLRRLRLQHRFDNRVRDLLSQLNAAAGPAPDQATREVVRQGLTLLELGHSVLELRGLIASSERSAARNALQDCVLALAAYFKTPAQDSCATAVGTVLRAGAAVRAELPDAAPERAARLRTALTDLHSIYTSLLDQLPQATKGSPHAA
jgi:uncharacterized membrane protein YccC